MVDVDAAEATVSHMLTIIEEAKPARAIVVPCGFYISQAHRMEKCVRGHGREVRLRSAVGHADLFMRRKCPSSTHVAPCIYIL